MDTPTESEAVTPCCSEIQARYVELERKKAAIAQLLKPFYEEYDAAFEAAINESGIKAEPGEIFFQDRFGVVHCIREVEWISVKPKPWEIAHTRRPEFGETRGSLSEKDAKASGFEPTINKGSGS